MVIRELTTRPRRSSAVRPQLFAGLSSLPYSDGRSSSSSRGDSNESIASRSSAAIPPPFRTPRASRACGRTHSGYAPASLLSRMRNSFNVRRPGRDDLVELPHSRTPPTPKQHATNTGSPCARGRRMRKLGRFSLVGARTGRRRVGTGYTAVSILWVPGWITHRYYGVGDTATNWRRIVSCELCG